jgi:hypothetical protein
MMTGSYTATRNTKSRAGRRIVAFLAELVPELRWHLERFAEP